MYFFGNTNERLARYHAQFKTPMNPICWLVGHKPKVMVIRPERIPPYMMIRCRVCDHRYNDVNQLKSKTIESSDSYQEFRNIRFQYYDRDPIGFVRDLDKRGPAWTNEGELELNIELSKPIKPLKTFSFRLHTGGRGSETPYDAHATIAGYGAYLSIGGLTGRWAEFIGQGHGRDLSLALHGGQLWWQLWYDGDGGNDEHHCCDSWRKPKLWPWSAGRRKHRGWMCLRDGNINVNPVDAFYGSRKYLPVKEFSKVPVHLVVGEFEGDEYDIFLQLELRHHRRDAGPAWAQKPKAHYWTAKWDAFDCGGIPVRNHEWKGDEILAGGVALKNYAFGREWIDGACELLKQQVLKDRKHYDYRPPVPSE